MIPSPLREFAHPRPLLKICGLTRFEDVALAAELGAWAVGFVFAPSPRRVTVDVARRLVPAAREVARSGGEGGGARPGPLTVGVFGDASTGEIVEAVDAVGLDAVQLHGSRPDAAALRKAFGDRQPRPVIILVVPVPADVCPTGTNGVAAGAGDGTDVLLFDTRVGNRSGGTGATFPWHIAREVSGDLPYLVAGGLGPRNIKDALEASGAWGADVSSGVEQSLGVKDHALLRALFAAVGGGPARVVDSALAGDLALTVEFGAGVSAAMALAAAGSAAAATAAAPADAARSRDMDEQRREGTTS